MKSGLVKDIGFFIAHSFINAPIADSTHVIPEIKFIVLQVETDNGFSGQSYMLTFHYLPETIKGALKDLKNFSLNKYRINETKKFLDEFKIESEYFGNTGLLKWMESLVNIAMWDAFAKENNKPIWELLNGNYKGVPVYGSGGWLSYCDEELVDEVKRYIARGFKAVKIKVGSKEIERDIQRLKKVREAAGSGIKIMIDANQGMEVEFAVKLAKSVENLEIYWFEEPIDHENFDGYKKIKESTNISLAMGEREYNQIALKELISLKAIDMWQPDIIRIGGVEKWIESSKYANDFGIPVLPHYYKEYDVPLLCTINNYIAAESFDWIDEFIDNQLEIKNGFAYPRKTPGWGFTFLQDKLTVLNI